MNGAAHYKEAERLLVKADECAASAARMVAGLSQKAALDINAAIDSQLRQFAARAEAHATLALAAAAVETNAAEYDVRFQSLSTWAKVLA